MIKILDFGIIVVRVTWGRILPLLRSHQGRTKNGDKITISVVPTHIDINAYMLILIYKLTEI